MPTKKELQKKLNELDIYFDKKSKKVELEKLLNDYYKSLEVLDSSTEETLESSLYVETSPPVDEPITMEVKKFIPLKELIDEEIIIEGYEDALVKDYDEKDYRSDKKNRIEYLMKNIKIKKRMGKDVGHYYKMLNRLLI